MIKKYLLFFTPMCPKCPKIKDFMSAQDSFSKEWVDASKPDGLSKARLFNVSSVPTVIFLDADDKEVSRANDIDGLKRILDNKSLV